MKKRVYNQNRPNSCQCEGCPEWDDINGCWDDIVDINTCAKIGEDGYYESDESDDDGIDGFEEDCYYQDAERQGR